MVSEIKYRYDFIGLSDDNKPTPSTSNEVVDGSTFYESDTSKLYVWYDDQWYEKEAGGGGGSVTLYDSVGQNEDGAMTQKATTDMIFGDGGTGYKIKIGSDTTDSGDDGIAIGHSASAGSNEGIVIGHSATIGADNKESIAIGHGASVSTTGGNKDNNIAIGHIAACYGKGHVAIGNTATTQKGNAVAIGTSTNAMKDGSVSIGWSSMCNQNYSIALGALSQATKAQGELGIGVSEGMHYGYNNTDYRIITGVHDGINNHCAATVAQGNTLSTSAPTTATEGVLGQLYTDTTNMHTYQCTAIDTTDPANPSYTWTQRW